MLTHDVALSRRFITRPGSLQVIKYAFEMAKKKNAKRITCGHKANIMKITDGLFLECFYEVAKEYPELKADDVIVDDLCMKLVTRPDILMWLYLPICREISFPISVPDWLAALVLLLLPISATISAFLKPFMEQHRILQEKILPIPLLFY